MSIFVTSSAWKGSHSEGTTLLVLLAISDFADDKGRAFPSVKTLATKARASERTVQYALRELIEKGELAIDRNAGPHGCNIYRVQLQAMTWEPVESEGGADSAGGANSAGVQPGSFGGATSCTRTTIEPSKKKQSAGAKRIPEPTFDPLTGKFDGIQPATIELWVKAHPDVDVQVELVRASCWLIANPERQKPRYLRFLFNWMGNARQKPATHRTESARPVSAKEANREAWAVEMAAMQQREADRQNQHKGNRNDDAIDV